MSAVRLVSTGKAVPHALLGIGGMPIRIESASPALAERVARWLEQAFLLAEESHPAASLLRLRVLSGEPREGPPAGARELVASTTWRVLRHGQVVFLHFPQARCNLDLGAGCAEVWLPDGWWGEPLKVQQDPWLLSLVWLLRERGRYALACKHRGPPRPGAADRRRIG